MTNKDLKALAAFVVDEMERRLGVGPLPLRGQEQCANADDLSQLPDRFSSKVLSGIDSLPVSHMLGHSTTRMVELVYGRLSGDTYKEAAERCAVFVSKSGPKDEIPGAHENKRRKVETPQNADNEHSEGFSEASPTRLERVTYGFEVPGLDELSVQNQNRKRWFGE